MNDDIQGLLWLLGLFAAIFVGFIIVMTIWGLIGKHVMNLIDKWEEWLYWRLR